MKKITDKQRVTLDLHAGVVALYKSEQYTTEQIADNYNLSPRQVQRIATKYKVIRTQADANRVAAPLKNYRTIPDEYKVKRKQLSAKKRYEVILNHPYCVTCGMRPHDGVRLEVDHIDENPMNNDDGNLQVLCSRCNTGKSHLARY